MNQHTQSDIGVFRNGFRTALEAGRPLVGIWSMLNSANAVEGLAYSGFDWILLDGEHSPLSLSDAMCQLRTLDGKGPAPIVRLVWNDPILLKQYLDAGATTLMLPFVQSAEEARDAVAAMRYPPHGSRGVALMHRASRYGRTKDYVLHAHEAQFLIVQIESAEALERIDEIAAVDGVDALFFGPSDLAASFGHVGEANHREVTAAIHAALPRVRAKGKYAGVLAPNAELAETHIARGFDFVSVANDCALLFSGADAAAARFRALADKASGGARLGDRANG